MGVISDLGLKQYQTTRGNIPGTVASAVVPDPTATAVATTFKYPQVYRNQEGSKEDARTNFLDWESRPTQLPATSTSTSEPVLATSTSTLEPVLATSTSTSESVPAATLMPAESSEPVIEDSASPSGGLEPPSANPTPTPANTEPVSPRFLEHPLRMPDERPYNLNQPPTPLRVVNRVIQPEDLEDHLNNPYNDPGPFRAIESHGHLVGVIFHPSGNPRGFDRAFLAPLDRQGRQDAQRQRDRETSRLGGHDTASSYPPR
ncbi:hypothetical protein FQN54_008947 [Arachnomyces sp. PD_36]|nr:hypothetical protein FQN54_008947 [Arachnomyces sp. PD_36]